MISTKNYICKFIKYRGDNLHKGQKRYYGDIIELKETDIFMGEQFRNITSDIVPGIYDYYQISNMGRVYHKYMGSFIKQGICGSGYYFFSVSTNNGSRLVRTHRIEMMVFYPILNYDEYDVNHKDGNKLNNVLWNLEWVSHSYNMHHAYEIGLHSRPTNLSDDIVIKICELLSKNIYTNEQIAIITNTSVNIVSSIKQRNAWKHLSSDYDFYQRPRKLLSDDMVENICLYFQNNPKDQNLSINKFCKKALIDLNYDSSDNIVDTVRKIYVRKYYTNISCKYNF